ncbi:hypothetical protein GQ54DRAFT_311709 [Martensiomyces pterosporus]|nr:hypothetical protein GQ54DRAFT_311709 [Martensiomyces pterosporus]
MSVATPAPTHSADAAATMDTATRAATKGLSAAGGDSDEKGAMSPLSSSTITIATLNSLSFDGPGSKLLANQSPASGGGLGIVTRKSNTDVRGSPTNTANDSSVDLGAVPSLELPVVNLRSVSVDYARVYGMQLNTPPSVKSEKEDNAAPGAPTSCSDQPAQQPPQLLGASKTQPLTSEAANSAQPPQQEEDASTPQSAGAAATAANATTAEDAAAENTKDTSSASSGRRRRRKTRNRAAKKKGEEEEEKPLPSLPLAAPQSKSLDIRRRPADMADGETRSGPGVLSRRVLQRNKRQNAVYASEASNAMGPARFQALPRSFASRLGLSSTLATTRRKPQDLRFVVAPHPRFPEVVEIIDCEVQAPIYRKVSRSSRSWHETFHEVTGEDGNDYYDDLGVDGSLLASHAYGSQRRLYDGEYEMAAALGIPPSPGGIYMNAFDAYGSGAGSSSGYTSVRNSNYFYYPSGATAAASGGASSGNGMARVGGPADGTSNAAAASCVTFQSTASSLDRQRSGQGGEGIDDDDDGSQAAAPLPISAARRSLAAALSTASILNAATMHMARASTSAGFYATGSNVLGPMFDRGLLWEALTPYPNQFPLHVKDSRAIIDNVSLSSMVLDRHLFCYRFQLGANRMKWTAKRVKKHQLALLCYVRGTLVAEVFVDYEKGYSPYNTPVPIDAAGAARATAGVRSGFLGSGSSSGESTPNTGEDTVVLPEDGTFPVITILSAAFNQLARFDPGVVESFIIFTGMQMLECLHI